MGSKVSSCNRERVAYQALTWPVVYLFYKMNPKFQLIWHVFHVEMRVSAVRMFNIDVLNNSVL